MVCARKKRAHDLRVKVLTEHFNYTKGTSVNSSAIAGPIGLRSSENAPEECAISMHQNAMMSKANSGAP